jgi:cyclohexyl-isocyanide hydratase
MIDVAATVDILGRIPSFWKERPFELDVVAASCDVVMTDQKVGLQPTKTFAECGDGPLDVLLVPGSGNTSSATGDQTYMDFVRDQASRAAIVMSVCTGALILAKAGLLDGYRATTHWIALDQLRGISNKIQVVNGYPRWVHDRNRITAGGVSSSADAALYLISVLTDEQTAKCAQLIVQYHPQPPFDAGDPAVADADTYFKVMG